MISARAAKTVAGSAFSPPAVEPFALAFESSAILCLIPQRSIFNREYRLAVSQGRGREGHLGGTYRRGDRADWRDRHLRRDGAGARARGGDHHRDGAAAV